MRKEWGAERRLASEFDELIDGEGDEGEAEMGHHFVWAADADGRSGELVLEAAEDAFDGGAFAEAIALSPS